MQLFGLADRWVDDMPAVATLDPRNAFVEQAKLISECCTMGANKHDHGTSIGTHPSRISLSNSVLSYRLARRSNSGVQDTGPDCMRRAANPGPYPGEDPIPRHQFLLFKT